MNGAFAVFGRSKAGSKLSAESYVLKHKMWNKEEKRPITLDEFRAMVDERAQKLFASKSSIKISPEFDAPQFCHDWIALAKDEIRCDGVRRKEALENGKFRWSAWKP